MEISKLLLCGQKLLWKDQSGQINVRPTKCRQSNNRVAKCWSKIGHQAVLIREDINRKKNVFFRVLPESPNPPPPDPNLGNFVLFFGSQNSRFESLELKILYILYNILYIYNLKKQFEVQIIGILEGIDSFIDQKCTS